jgi:uncharacterized protein YfdQ (DUF2303 family)
MSTTGGSTSNNQHKRAFLWGVAMHQATDVFAHSAYYNAGTSWARITHNANTGPGHADNPNVIPARWTAATKTAELVVARYNSGLVGTAYQLDSAVLPAQYRLKNYYSYMCSPYAGIGSFIPPARWGSISV